jgi:hypothetical protein
MTGTATWTVSGTPAALVTVLLAVDEELGEGAASGSTRTWSSSARGARPQVVEAGSESALELIGALLRSARRPDVTCGAGTRREPVGRIGLLSSIRMNEAVV